MLRAEVRTTFTVVYRGYAIEVSQGTIGWRAGVYPRRADLPILYRNEVQTFCPAPPSFGKIAQQFDKTLRQARL